MRADETALPRYLRAALLSPWSLGALALGLLPALLGFWPSVLLPALLGIELVLVSLLATSLPFRRQVDARRVTGGSDDSSNQRELGRLITELQPAEQRAFSEAVTAARATLEAEGEPSRAGLDQVLWTLLRTFTAAAALGRFLAWTNRADVEAEIDALSERRAHSSASRDCQILDEALVAARARLMNIEATEQSRQVLLGSAENLIASLTGESSEAGASSEGTGTRLRRTAESAEQVLSELSYMTGEEQLGGDAPRIL